MEYYKIVLIAFILLVVFTASQVKKFCDFLKSCTPCKLNDAVAPKTVLAASLPPKPVEIEKKEVKVEKAKPASKATKTKVAPKTKVASAKKATAAKTASKKTATPRRKAVEVPTRKTTTKKKK